MHIYTSFIHNKYIYISFIYNSIYIYTYNDILYRDMPLNQIVVHGSSSQISPASQTCSEVGPGRCEDFRASRR